MKNEGLSHTLSSTQLQFWAGQKRSPDSPMYNMAFNCSITGAVNSVKFVCAWDEALSTQIALRARFKETNGEPHQYFIESAPPLTLLDFSSEANPHEVCSNWMNSRVRCPFGLTESLVESALIKVTERHWEWFFNAHHLVVDANSFSMLWRSICCAYQKSADIDYLTDAEVKKYDFPAYLIDEKKARFGVDDEASRFWSSTKSAEPLTLYGEQLKNDNTLAQRYRIPLDEQINKEIQKLASMSEARGFSKEVSQFNVMLAVYAVYLHRVSGALRLRIYTPAPNRSTHDLRDCSGVLIEMLPIDIQLDETIRFDSLLHQVRAQVQQSFRYLRPGIGEQLAQSNAVAVFNYVPQMGGSFCDMPARINWLHCGHIDTHHVMRLHMTQFNHDSFPTLLFEFNQSVVSTDKAPNAISHFLFLLKELAGQPQAAIGSISINEFDDFLSLHQSGKSAIQPLLLDSIRQKSVESSKSIAVVDNEASLSYQQVVAVSDALALRLIQSGVRKGDRVGVYMPRNALLPLCLLACFKAGAAYVPIDANLPNSRVKMMLEHANVSITLVTIDTREKLHPTIKQLDLSDVNAFNEHPGTISKSDGLLLEQRVPFADDCAYIMYTSGSTGVPKGVVITHAALNNYIQWAKERYTEGRALTFPFYTSIGFDLTVTSIFVPLVSGGCIRVYPDGGVMVDTTLIEVLEDNECDIIKMTPAHLALIEHLDLSKSRVRQLIVGGEDLKAVVAKRTFMSFPSGLKIHNEYGPTEATVGCVVHSIDASFDDEGSVPIGLPVAGMRADVFNTYGIAQPKGVAGELWLSGPSLSTGYYAGDQLQQQRFVKGQDGVVRYRTGDLVRVNSAGLLLYQGRIDDQIKVKGVRIEPAEIENAALQLPGISSCVALLYDNNNEHLDYRQCERCGLTNDYPDVKFDANGVCHLCQGFEKYKYRADLYFKPTAELELKVMQIKEASPSDSQYDCLLLLSGGKDSSYVLSRLCDLGLRVLAFTLDNGYISDGAKQNISRVCAALGVDHQYGKTPHMNAIFADSLNQHANVCQGCFKTIYTLALKLAEEQQIGTIFTGLSRGQFFETRLTEELFTQPGFNVEKIDEVVLDARKHYHRRADEVNRCLDVDHVKSGDLLDRIEFVDFYRYCSVDLDEMLDHLETRLPWIRPADTGRSTNCLINDVGIYVHKLEKGYHNYALPYSWDVRLGHKKRDAALEELDDEIDEAHVKRILSEVNYQPKSPLSQQEQVLTLYYQCDSSFDEKILVDHLSSVLPTAMLPGAYMALDVMPLNLNGKIDRSALLPPNKILNVSSTSYKEAKNELQQHLVDIWCQVLKRSSVGIDENLFEIGGDSLKAIQLISRMNQRGYNYTVSDLFEHPTIEYLSTLNRQDAVDEKNQDKVAQSFSSVSSDQMAKLSELLGKRS